MTIWINNFLPNIFRKIVSKIEFTSQPSFKKYRKNGSTTWNNVCYFSFRYVIVKIDNKWPIYYEYMIVSTRSQNWKEKPTYLFVFYRKTLNMDVQKDGIIEASNCNSVQVAYQSHLKLANATLKYARVCSFRKTLLPNESIKSWSLIRSSAYASMGDREGWHALHYHLLASFSFCRASHLPRSLLSEISLFLNCSPTSWEPSWNFFQLQTLFFSAEQLFIIYPLLSIMLRTLQFCFKLTINNEKHLKKCKKIVFHENVYF